MDAILLAQLFPQDADALMQHARDIGWRRVVKGVHTLQDIYAGRGFGTALATDMLASPTLQHDLAAAREDYGQPVWLRRRRRPLRILDPRPFP